MDMTQGPIMSKLIRFGMPVLLGMLFQRIYNFADAYIVGRYLGDGPLDSVSIAGRAMYLLMSLMMGLTTGVSVVVSQYYGAGDTKKVKETFVTSIYVCAAVTAFWAAIFASLTASSRSPTAGFRGAQSAARKASYHFLQSAQKISTSFAVAMKG